MIGGDSTAVLSCHSANPGDGARRSLSAMDTAGGASALSWRSDAEFVIPPPLVNERDALAGLLCSRLHTRCARAGESIDYPAARALARRLLQPTPLAYREIEDILGQNDRRRTRALLECLTRVGLVFDAGNSVVLLDTPVKLQVFFGHTEPPDVTEDATDDDATDNDAAADVTADVAQGRGPEDWFLAEPGVIATLAADVPVRVVASSRMALELRVYRVLHRASGGILRRSITQYSLVHGRVVDIAFEPPGCSEVTDCVEQVLVHVAWANNVRRDDNSADTVESLGVSGFLADRIGRERLSLLAYAGLGWVSEYLVVRSTEATSALP